MLERVAERVVQLERPPNLVFIRVGEDPASASYVRSKERSARKTGIRARTLVLPDSTGQQELESHIAELSADDAVDGILLQLPLPFGLDPVPAIALIDPDSAADVLHPISVGRLWIGGPGLFPCTALGLIVILDHYDIGIEGREVVIVGRSQLVGKPAAALFLRR